MSALVDSPRPAFRFGLKQLAIGALLVVLGAVSAFALMRETRTLRQERAPVAAAPQVPERPPLTAGEEAYAQALWDVHAGVRTEAVRMTFAGLSYKMGDIKRADVKDARCTVDGPLQPGTIARGGPEAAGVAGGGPRKLSRRSAPVSRFLGGDGQGRRGRQRRTFDAGPGNERRRRRTS